MVSRIFAFSSFFPRIPLRAGTERERALSSLGAESRRYFAMAAAASAALSVLLALIVSGEYAVPLALLSFAAFFGFFVILPDMEIGRAIAEIEMELPFFLRGAGMLLEMGLPIGRALGRGCEEGGYLGREIGLIMDDVRGGAGFQASLSSFARSYPSLAIKRALSQVLLVYETGGHGSDLRKMGDDMISLQQHRMREHSARSALFGMLFIISCAVLPAFFLIYAVAGSFGLGSEPDEGSVAIFFLVVFPLVSLLILLLSRASAPRSSFSQESGFDLLSLAPGALMAAGTVILPQNHLAWAALGGGAGIVLAWGSYRTERRTEAVEAALPDALFSVGGIGKAAKPEVIFAVIERGAFGALSEEAGKSRRQLEMNVHLEKVLEDLWRRNRSLLLRRCCVMLGTLIETGTNERIGLIAEDLVRNFQLRRERAAQFAMQKYTLVLGSLVIPLILRITLGLAGRMEGIGDAQGVHQVISSAEAVIPAYLVIYAVMASAAIADGEGRRSAAALYSAALSAAGLLAFHFISL